MSELIQIGLGNPYRPKANYPINLKIDAMRAEKFLSNAALYYGEEVSLESALNKAFRRLEGHLDRQVKEGRDHASNQLAFQKRKAATKESQV